MQDKLRKGEALFTEGKIEEAEKSFLELLNKNSEDAEVLNNLGVISHAKGSFEKSESYLLKAISVKEDYLDALLNLSDLYQSSERWEKAAIQLEKYLKIDNQDHNVFNQLALFYLEAGNIQNARSVLEHSLELKPGQDIVIESLKQLQTKEEIPYYLPKLGSFRAAFIEVNITPNVSEQNPVFLQGMGGAPRKAIAISEPLMMQLLLLEDDHFTKILFVTADLFGFGPEIVDNVRTLVAQWGIDPEGLILNASHTHYAPGTISHASKSIGPFYGEYSKKIVQAISQQLLILYDKLEACEFFWGKVEAQIGVSRRLKKEGKVIFAPNPEGYYDKDTPFLLLHMLKTDKKALLVNHGCHPTGLGSENFISADYPGYMRDALKSNGVVDGVMFLQGGAGSTKETVSTNGNLQFCANSKGARENGQILSKRIIDAFEKGLQPVNGSLFCTRRIIRLPLKSPPPPRVLAQIRDNTGTDDLVRKWASHLLDRFPNGNFPDELNLEVQLVSLGDKVTIVTLPGEPVAELASKLRRLTGNPNSTFILGYTNGLIGYLPTDTMIEEGGYETDVSKFAYLLPSSLSRGTESAIISGAENCIGATAYKENPTGYGRYHLVKKDQKAFFVLSAGRCGTMTLAHLLNTASNARVWHHPQPDPINESLQAYWDNIDKIKTFWKARYTIIHKTWSQGLIHGETDLLMTPFCDMISEEIPNSKFIVLVRDPRDFVRSGMRRNYYHGHPWDFGRLRPKEGAEEFEEWRKLDQFSKICWLWNETYHKINSMINKIGEDRMLVVRFEDLISSIEKTMEIFDYLDLKGFDEEKIRTILSHKLNKQLSGTYTKPENWSADLHDTLWRICGKTAEKYGYFHSYKIKTSVKTNKCNKPITIWDFKKFKHQPYPSGIDLSFFKVNKNGIPLIDKRTKITSIGSCFARNIAVYLISRQYNYLVTENPFQEASAHWDQVFNTACMRQIFEYTLNDNWRPQVRWWPKGEMVQDPFRRNIIYNKETCDQDFACHRRKSYEALTEAEIIILTLGLIETWRDRRDKMTYYRVPSPKVYDPNIHEFYVQNIQDCQSDLDKIHRLLKQHNPKANIIVTVSPVPLFATFRMDVDAVTANSLSKSTLRVVAEYFSQRHENVYYFPSYEIVTQGIASPYEKDNRHVTEDTINKVMEVFESRFID
jgi:hypothetical protein